MQFQCHHEIFMSLLGRVGMNLFHVRTWPRLFLYYAMKTPDSRVHNCSCSPYVCNIFLSLLQMDTFRMHLWGVLWKFWHVLREIAVIDQRIETSSIGDGQKFKWRAFFRFGCVFVCVSNVMYHLHNILNRILNRAAYASAMHATSHRTNSQLSSRADEWNCIGRLEIMVHAQRIRSAL